MPVPEVSVLELRALLADESESVVLVDVRSEAEYAVSVIPGAITKEQFEANRDELCEKHVVAYCTVGGRSFVYARQLRRQGIHASNFGPSIIGWCEANGELVTLDGIATNRAHVYSSAFSVPEPYEAVTE